MDPKNNCKYRPPAGNLLLMALLCLMLSGSAYCQVAAEPVSAETKQQRDQRMKWWRQAKFGMFIHWGLYAIPAGRWKGRQIPGIGEWIMNRAQIPISEYEQLAPLFNPVEFDADRWVALAADAGMRYIVITSKHHDGFSLWDSKVTDYDVIDATPFKRDILKELSNACDKYGIRLCFYHSIMDWHHPDAQGPHYPTYNTREKKNPNFPRYVQNYLKPQIRELVTGYGDIGVLWFDGDWIPEWTQEYGRDMYAFVRGLKPDIIINNRVSKGRKGMTGLTEQGFFSGDFGTPEQRIPATGLPGVDWETCMTMNDTWGFKQDDRNWKSSEDLIRKLVDIAGKGGNFLLNVGPTAEGLIPDASIERLRTMGKWLKVNGQSVYGTTANPLGELAWGRCTARPGRLYLHVFDWPKDGILQVPGVKGKVQDAYLLADNRNKPAFTQEKGRKLIVKLTGVTPDPVDTVVVLEVGTGKKVSGN